MTLVAKTFRPAYLLVVFVFFLVGCDQPPEPVRLQGLVFGTGWNLTYQPEEGSPSAREVRSALEEAFELVNVSMNTYDPASRLSRFNALPAGETMEMDWDFTYVFNEALQITTLSDGAYDVSLAPLLDVWGFGPNGPESFPDDDTIDSALQRVGMDNFDWQPTSRRLSKVREGVSIELSSIAKGYGVDLGADALDELGIKHFMLEIGGEVQLRGMSPRGDLWRIAIEKPESGGRGVQAAVALTDLGLATSGDYRNYFERDGKRYSHLVDPRTGYPIEHDLVSVTVIDPSTALADAWATAFSVMGVDATLALATERNMPVYVIRRVGDSLEATWSEAFEPFLVSPTAGS